nr:hypothetical protein [Bacteroidota bacterium]
MRQLLLFLVVFSTSLVIAQSTSLVSPVTGFVQLEGGVNFSWNEITSNLDYYHLETGDNPSFSTSTTYNVYGSDSTINLLSGKYFWRVRPVVNNMPGNWSEIRFFSVINIRTIGNLGLWLRADTGIVLDATNKIMEWKDGSSNNYNLIQNTIALRPSVNSAGLNGKPVVQFNGSNQLSNINPIVIGSYFTVFNYTNTTNTLISGLAGATANPRFVLPINSAAVFIHSWAIFPLNGIFVNKTTNLNVPPNNSYIISAKRPTPVNFLNYSLAPGHSGYDRLNGFIAEDIMFSNTVTDSVKGLIEDYLRFKYAPPVNLGKDTVVASGFCDVTLSAGSGFVTYNWSTGATTMSANVNKPGKYWVTVTDVFGFSSTDTINVIRPSYNFGLPSNLSFCNGSTAVI